ncbi:hypothetical protein Tco_0460192, partial [Tanacetum coccineum]
REAVERLLAIPTLPPSPLSLWSSSLHHLPLAPDADTYEIYTRLDDEQSERQLMVGRLNMLYRDMRAYVRTARLIEAEARMS